MGIFTAIASSTGTFDAVSAASAVYGTAVFCGTDAKSVDGLVANVTCKAETNTFTITPKWQVSADNSTWVDAAVANNAANVTLATGTSGTDAAVSRCIAAPDLSACNWVRLALVAGGTTGSTSDTYTISYTYRDPR